MPGPPAPDAGGFVPEPPEGMYVFPGSFLEADLLRCAMIDELHEAGGMVGFHLAVCAPCESVPELWLMLRKERLQC